MSKKREVNPLLMQYDSVLKFEQEKSKRLEEFKERIKVFANVTSLEKAKELAAKILPTSQEINRFYVGDAQCTVVNNENTLRISVSTANEFISYSF